MRERQGARQRALAGIHTAERRVLVATNIAARVELVAETYPLRRSR